MELLLLLQVDANANLAGGTDGCAGEFEACVYILVDTGVNLMDRELGSRTLIS